MTCSRCGGEAAVKRDAAFYCGKCAIARDWEDVIAVVQADAGYAGAGVLDFSAQHVAVAAARPVVAEGPGHAADGPAPEPVPHSVERTAEAPSSRAPQTITASVDDGLPADPFG